MVKTVKACLLTGVLGDAFGSKFELSDIPAGDDSWKFTDDTQLVVATCESILEVGQVDPGHIAKTMQKWYSTGRINGIGASTLMAMVQLVGGASWKDSGAKGERAAGNGAAMRIAPLGFLLDATKEEDRETIRQVCRITHQNEEAYVGALAVLLAIRFMENDRPNFLPNVIRHLPASEVRNRIEQIARMPNASIRDVARKNGNSGWVVESVPFALFAASQAGELGIQAMMKSIASSGGDTDTNCAIAGQVAGTHLGYEAIPEEWMDKLQRTRGYGEYYVVLKRFAEFVNQSQGIQTLF